MNQFEGINEMMDSINKSVKPTDRMKEITNLTIQRHSRMMADQILTPLAKPFQDMIDASTAKRKAEWAALPWYKKAYRKIRGALHG